MSTRRGESWTEEEDDTLRRMYETHTHQQIAEALGRTNGGVRSRCWTLGLNDKHPPHWEQWEVDALRELYESHPGVPVPLAEFAEKIGRLKSNVSRKARELGLTDTTRRLPNRRRNAKGMVMQPRKFATDEELKQYTSERTKKLWQERGHPRGALGMKHSDEAKEKMRLGVQKWRENATPEQLESVKAKTKQTCLERYGKAAPFPSVENAYSRCRRGRREDLGFSVRSGWEANYARYLKFLKDRGDIQDWDYEKVTFRFEGVTRAPYTYTPDFRVVENDGRVVFHEVKGWMDSKSKSRLKRMAKHYPLVDVVVIDAKRYREIAQLAPLIPHWEY